MLKRIRDFYDSLKEAQVDNVLLILVGLSIAFTMLSLVK